ncbi:salt tolerance receptor-like cytoplasmic kinase 1 [Curcuma longa]|uniref:salt tolerance receptor-like cytoplasmic kinase 1 n=1 Tax=Curcuma longa TaxID=136217 RepID=UPI003D9EAC71
MHLALLITLLLLASAAAVLTISLATVAYFKMFRRRKPFGGCFGGSDDFEMGPARARVADGPGTEPEKGNPAPKQAAVPRLMGWAEVESATGKFSPSAVVGEGGSSTVYLARFPDSSLAALKLHRPSERLHHAFRQELDLLLRLCHPHIVRLLGYCDDREAEGALVFEYVPNGSLHEKLHGGGAEVLPWARRVAVAHQVAQALDYLHEGCDPQVVHGDVKAANVLLDGRMEAKLCDFGSARVGFSAAVAPPRPGGTMVVGSPGYVDPHYLRSGMISKKSDVYSFGVLLLELVTGAEAFDAERERRLTADMAPVLRDVEVRAAEVVDPGLAGEYDAGEVAKVLGMAAMCLGDNPSLRPSMSHVVRMLQEKTAASIGAVAVCCGGKHQL